MRFPTSGEHWVMDQVHYPRDRCWDRLAAATGAVTLHFGDEPAMAAFDCPDTSHLNHDDAAEFTRSLMGILDDRGILPGASGR